MTTIAEFLNKTSGNQFPTELYKEAWSIFDFGKKKLKQAKNTAKAVGSAVATVGSALSGAASTAVDTLEDGAAINDINKAPTEANVRNFLNKHINELNPEKCSFSIEKNLLPKLMQMLILKYIYSIIQS